MGRKKHKFPSASKARLILREGRARGQPLSARQKRFFGFIAGGGKPTRRRFKVLHRRYGS